MRRSAAVVLTLAVFAAVAVCFLRPGGGDMPDPSVIRIAGEGADRFELVYVGVLDDSDRRLLCFTVRPLDGKSYTLGSMTWLPRHRDLNGALGRMYKLYEDGWREYSIIESELGWYAMFSPKDVERVLVRPESPLSFVCALPMQEEGRYRGTFLLREYDPEQMRTGEGVCEVSFEYEVPRSGALCWRS